jgi:hypothetical protein
MKVYFSATIVLVELCLALPAQPSALEQAGIRTSAAGTLAPPEVFQSGEVKPYRMIPTPNVLYGALLPDLTYSNRCLGLEVDSAGQGASSYRKPAAPRRASGENVIFVWPAA